MRQLPLAAFLVLFVCAISFAQQPLIYPSLTPVSTAPGGPAFTLTVNGTGFVSGDVVQWNGSPRTTAFVSSGLLQASITAADIAKAGTALINVLSSVPGVGVSNTDYFPVTTPEETVSVALDSSLTTPSSAPAFTVGDFNGDGILDVVAEVSTPALKLAFYAGNGNGTFQKPILSKIDQPPAGYEAFLQGDLNGDGKLDLIFNNASGSQTYLNNGNGTFSQGPSAPGGGTIVALGDFNGDGKLDALAETCSEGFCNLVFLGGEGNGRFSEGGTIQPNMNLGGVTVVGDFNGDGKLDFAQPGLVFLGNGDGTFQAPITVANLPGDSIATADLNGDGKLDLVTTGEDTGLCIALGNGDGTFNSSCTQYGSSLYGLNLGDFNGDGKLDIAVNFGALYPAAYQIEILPGNGNGTFGTPIVTGANTDMYLFGDFNNDGRLDFANGIGMGVAVNLQSAAALSPLSLTYASYEAGQSSPPQVVTLTNSGTSPLKIVSVAIGGLTPADFSAQSHCQEFIAAGDSCTINVVFKPATAGTFYGTLNVTYGGTPQTSQLIELSGTGLTTTDTLTPSSLSFGFQIIGTTSAPQTLTLQNTGPQTLTGIAVGTAAPYNETTNCGTTLAPSATCEIFVTYSPTSIYGVGAVSVSSDAQNGPVSAGLSGTGTELIVSPTSVNFGNQAVGTTSSSQTVTLTNASKSSMLHLLPVTITGSDKNDFAETNNCGTKLGPAASCTVTITFTPTATGALSASLNTDGYYGLQPVALSGTGTQ